MNKVLIKCDEFVAKKKGSRSHWHPILGWYSEPLERRLIPSQHCFLMKQFFFSFSIFQIRIIESIH